MVKLDSLYGVAAYCGFSVAVDDLNSTVVSAEAQRRCRKMVWRG
jgi:hypothetical protein